MKKPWIVVAVACLVGLGAAGWMLSGNALASGIKGTADNITDSSLSVSGKTVLIDSNTRIEGNLTPGARVEVKTRKDESGPIATLIHVTSASERTVTDEADNENENENPSEGENEQSQGNSEIEGVVTSVSGDTFVVDGKTIILNNSTRIEGEVRVGSDVEVEAQTQPDGTLLAVKIEMGEEVEVDQQEQRYREADDDEEEAEEQGLHSASIPQPTPPPANSTPVSYSSSVQPIVSQNCVTCHSNMATYSGLMKYVNPGNAGSSTIYRAIAGGGMPPGSSLSPSQIKAIADWIWQGAPNN